MLIVGPQNISYSTMIDHKTFLKQIIIATLYEVRYFLAKIRDCTGIRNYCKNQTEITAHDAGKRTVLPETFNPGPCMST